MFSRRRRDVYEYVEISTTVSIERKSIGCWVFDSRERKVITELKPLDERIVVERIEEEEEATSGHIIIPDTAKEKPRIGRVIAVGTNEDLQELVKAGDKVLYGKYVGDEIKLEGKEYLIVERGDILAIVVD